MNIKGILLPYISPETGEKEEAKINGYVDDSQLFVSTVESINECFKVFNCYELCSGAEVNKNKTLDLYTGSWKNKKKFK